VTSQSKEPDSSARTFARPRPGLDPIAIKNGPYEGHPSNTCAHSHRLLTERGAGTSPSGVIPFRYLNRSLPVERTSVVFSAMTAL
jgi:hypothetical protein